MPGGRLFGKETTNQEQDTFPTTVTQVAGSKIASDVVLYTADGAPAPVALSNSPNGTPGAAPPAYATQLAGTDGSLLQALRSSPFNSGVLLTEARGASFLNIVGNTTTVVKSGAGVLVGLTYNNGSGATVITLYDNTSAAGTKLGTISLGAAALTGTTQMWGVFFSTGLTIVTAGPASNDHTVIYR